ncbi:uncharacterized protein LOC18030309 isoform X1 [Eutrema salsugineum]|uniref:uncharacterized protein LOC18030309 isoform X1 n=1 Tax=Eutrema salsugineum TaxID=72664 RepID=UPI000CED25CB|nr:uncharacterized protein LOC18030309 isoform X1 [Eutrema salsugineum]
MGMSFVGDKGLHAKGSNWLALFRRFCAKDGETDLYYSLVVAVWGEQSKIPKYTSLVAVLTRGCNRTCVPKEVKEEGGLDQVEKDFSDPDFLMVADDPNSYRSCVQSPGVEMKGFFLKLQVHIQEIRRHLDKVSPYLVFAGLDDLLFIIHGSRM